MLYSDLFLEKWSKIFLPFLGERVKGFYDIDVSIGRDVTFQVNFALLKDCKIPISKEVTTKVDVKLAGGNQQCQQPLHITLVAPDDLHTLEIDEDFQVDHNQIWLHNLAKKTTIILILTF